MNIPSLYHFRALLLVLLLGVQWCGAALIHSDVANGNQPTQWGHCLSARCDDAPVICSADDFSSLPGLLRFNGKTLVGMEDSLTIFQQVKACADTPLALLFDARSGFKDSVFADSTALPEQSLFVQHTRLQI